jgi:uncharacterized protein YjbI with pentapeptide repeats
MGLSSVTGAINDDPVFQPSESSILRTVKPLRVSSELKLLYVLISSFVENTETSWLNGEKENLASSIEVLIAPHFIHLVSQGDKRDLLSDNNRWHLLKLGMIILECAGNKASAILVQSELQGKAERNYDWLQNVPINDDTQRFGRLFESKPRTKLHLGQDLSEDLLETEKARTPAIRKAVMAGYLCLKINLNGFGVREEEALRRLGGNPDVFKAEINSRFEHQYNQYELTLGLVSDGSSGVKQISAVTAQFLNSNDLLKRGTFGRIIYQYGTAQRIFGRRRKNYVDLSSRFKSLSDEDVNKFLSLSGCDPHVQSVILDQINKSHEAMMQGPPASGERQILPGIWASTLKDDISRYSEQPLNRLDLSNCDMSEVDLFRRQLEGCRFDGTNLRGANCRETKFGGSRFSDADLTGALLKSTDLRGCDLSTANLSHVGWLFKPPILDGYTKFFPDDCRTPSDVRKHLNRFQGWDEEMVDEFLELASTYKLSPTQRRSFRQLKDILLNPKQSPILLATSAEILTITSAIGTTSEEAQKALSRISRLTDSAGIPVLRDHDFSNQDLTNRPLRGAFMERVSLNGASLAGKDLRSAVISNSDLRGANLKGADLSGALLVNVDLTGADLSEVNLTETKLINCLIDEVKLDRVKMINTEMQQSTFANVTITEGIIEDLIVCQSYLHDINFVGSAEGSGLLVSGLALVDSVGLNLQFSGNTELTQLQLMGSLGLGSGGDEAELIIEGSEWHDQLVQVVTDPDLGVLEHGLEVTRVRTRNTNSPNRPLRRNGPDQTSTAFLVRMLVSRGGDLMGSYPILEHLERLTIGYQAGEVQRDEKNQISPQLILPASFTRGQ